MHALSSDLVLSKGGASYDGTERKKAPQGVSPMLLVPPSLIANFVGASPASALGVFLLCGASCTPASTRFCISSTFPRLSPRGCPAVASHLVEVVGAVFSVQGLVGAALHQVPVAAGWTNWGCPLFLQEDPRLRRRCCLRRQGTPLLGPAFLSCMPGRTPQR